MIEQRNARLNRRHDDIDGSGFFGVGERRPVPTPADVHTPVGEARNVQIRLGNAGGFQEICSPT